jgi:hypothetical protein
MDQQFATAGQGQKPGKALQHVQDVKLVDQVRAF